jgi:hypothetical protein
MMRLLEMNQEEWQKVASYVDTLCLPIYSLSFTDKQWQDASRKRCEYVARSLEKQLAGRMLLLPAICYTGGELSIFREYLRSLLQSWQQSGFHYVILIGNQKYLQQNDEKEVPFSLHQAILPQENDTAMEELDQATEKLYEEVLQQWVKNT